MESLKKNKILLSTFFVVLIIFVVYQYASPKVQSVQTETQDTIEAGSKTLSLLNEVQRISIDDTLFSSTVWTSLKDFSAPPVNTQPGKQDLFAPVGQ